MTVVIVVVVWNEHFIDYQMNIPGMFPVVLFYDGIVF
jgi:hypothetical protein